MSQFLDGKFFSILSSLGSRIMMFILILTILTAILHLLSLIYKPNPYLIL
ncbi:MAG: hypothetical protein LBH96_05555 [Candidatus Peribacteria bacterium]|nr:hypothetical protein [Candidatus Peribacteria bacterium]